MQDIVYVYRIVVVGTVGVLLALSGCRAQGPVTPGSPSTPADTGSAGSASDSGAVKPAAVASPAAAAPGDKGAEQTGGQQGVKPVGGAGTLAPPTVIRLANGQTVVMGEVPASAAPAPSRVTSIVISKSQVILSPGQKTSLSAVVTLVDGKKVTGVNWTSSDESVVTVSSAGALTTVGTGVAQVVATAKEDPNFSAMCEVLVGKQVKLANGQVMITY